MTEYANDEFWAAYAEYVKETRAVHQRVTTLLTGHRPLTAIVDLGCGRTKEALRLFSPLRYIGVDADPAVGADITMNYRDVEGLRLAMKHPNLETLRHPSTFVSLFSTELTASPEVNTEYYAKLFNTFPSLRRGVVAGFYYSRRRTEPTVSEAGGLTSWQSIGDLTVSMRETRVALRVPSKLFGDDVVEVWRLLERA